MGGGEQRVVGTGTVTMDGHEGTFWGPGALLGTKALLCPPFLVCRKKVSASKTFPELQRADSNSY